MSNPKPSPPSASGASPEASPEASSRAFAKPERVLACVLCQQRKIKCDRKFPCAQCSKAGAQCAPATTVSRQRRRRFPERDLLERLRHYESLLRQHDVSFEPMHPSTPGKPSLTSTKEPRERLDNEALHPTSTEAPRPPNNSTSIKSEPIFEPK